jgi:purine-nucleoside phosphorylase
MSIHIEAKKGEIAPKVLMPGDPLRAKWIAEHFLQNPKPYNSVRNMLGFTGMGPSGLVSVQGGGMGIPSLSIYANELFEEYDVQEIVRVGTCGGLQDNLKIGDVILAQGACSESAINKRRFRGMDFAPLADWGLLKKAEEIAKVLSIPVRVGNVVAVDLFHNDIDPEEWKLWAKYGVLAVDMETSELYTLAALHRRKALAILTVSDVLPTKEQASAAVREHTFGNMVGIALR